MTATSNKQKVNVFFSVYGELTDRNTNGAIVEILHPKEGGTYIRLMGCSFLFKGDAPQSAVTGIGLAKSMISYIPREIILRSVVFSGAALFLYFFSRKRFINYVDKYFTIMRRHVMRQINLPTEHYNAMTIELATAMAKALQAEFPGLDPEKDLVDYEPYESYGKGTFQLATLIAKITGFICLFLELDAAYRFPLQDVLENVDKDNAWRRPINEVRRLIDIIISREYAPNQQHLKWRFIKMTLSLFLLTSARARRLTRLFLLHLDIEQVKLDDHDWYFCLWRHYNYRGMSLEERMKERERLDVLRGHDIPVIEWDAEQQMYAINPAKK